MKQFKIMIVTSVLLLSACSPESFEGLNLGYVEYTQEEQARAATELDWMASDGRYLQIPTMIDDYGRLRAAIRPIIKP